MVAAASLTDETDPILSAARQAPLVEWTAEEQALLADVKGRPVVWIPNDQFIWPVSTPSEESGRTVGVRCTLSP